MGNVEGRSGAAHTTPGGPELLIDGTPAVGNRGQLDFRELGPVGPPRLTYRQVDWAPADNVPGNRVDLAGNWGGFGRVHPDAGGVLPGLFPLVNALLGAQDFAILDPATLGAAGLLVTGLLVEQQGVSGLVTAPTVSLGTNAPNYDDVIPQTLLSMATGADQRAHVLLPTDWAAGAGPTSVLVPSGVTLFFRVHAGAAGTALSIRPYVVGLPLL